MKVVNNARQEILNIFRESIEKHDLSKVKSILVLGGPLDEPELQVLKGLGIFKICFAGVEEIPGSNWMYLDLNNQNQRISEKFDLVLCSQVLEHVWNTSAAFSNISGLLNRDGFAWIACPASNFIHGSPDFYSAGYSREFLDQLSLHNNLEVLCGGLLSNPRIYLYRHLLNLWPTDFQMKFPLIAYFGVEGTNWKKFIWQFKTLVRRMVIVSASPKYDSGVAYPIEVWVFCKKSN